MNITEEMQKIELFDNIFSLNNEERLRELSIAYKRAKKFTISNEEFGRIHYTNYDSVMSYKNGQYEIDHKQAFVDLAKNTDESQHEKLSEILRTVEKRLKLITRDFWQLPEGIKKHPVAIFISNFTLMDSPKDSVDIPGDIVTNGVLQILNTLSIAVRLNKHCDNNLIAEDKFLGYWFKIFLNRSIADWTVLYSGYKTDKAKENT